MRNLKAVVAEEKLRAETLYDLLVYLFGSKKRLSVYLKSEDLG